MNNYKLGDNILDNVDSPDLEVSPKFKWLYFVKYFQVLFGIILCLTCCYFYQYVIRAWLVLGKLPEYGDPSLYDLGIGNGNYRTILTSVLDIGLYSFLGIVFCYILNFATRSYILTKWQKVICFLGVI